jgi:hypothetical protein
MEWTSEVLATLQTLIQRGFNYRDIAAKLNSTPSAVEAAIRRHNLKGVKIINQSINKNTIENINLDECEDSNFEDLKQKAKLNWNVAKSNIPNNKVKDFETYIIMGDHHVPEHDKMAIRAILRLMDDVKFDGIINVGDFLDLGCISHWNKGKNKTLEGKRLKSDYVEGNLLLDEFDKRLPKNAKKHYFIGNHEDWLNQLIEEQPALDGLFDLQSGLKLKERGYKVYDYNEIVGFGRLKITHGIYCGANPAKTHVIKTLSNILVGHVHSPEMVLVHSPAKEVSVCGYTLGCLCGMAPEYMKNKPHNWASGFAVMYLFKDGSFDINLIRIVKNRFVFNGKVYYGV